MLLIGRENGYYVIIWFDQCFVYQHVRTNRTVGRDYVISTDVVVKRCDGSPQPLTSVDVTISQMRCQHVVCNRLAVTDNATQIRKVKRGYTGLSKVIITPGLMIIHPYLDTERSYIHICTI